MESRETYEINIGDEVYLNDKNDKRVVTAFCHEESDYPEAMQLTKNGMWVVTPIKNLRKTERHYDQIKQVLNQLWENE